MKRIRSMIYMFLFLSIFSAAVHSSEGFIPLNESLVKTADWSKMETVEVVLDEFSFAPETLTFRVNVPYKLQIRNNGKMKHYFTAEEFFRAIAARKVQSNTDGEIKANYFLALEVFPGRSLDLYFIPVKQGSYKLQCTIEGHKASGMHGTIMIK